MRLKFCLRIFILVLTVSCTPLQEEESSSDETGSDGTGESRTVAFVTLGDWGSGDDVQRSVAEAIGSQCLENKCDFVLTLGDNFYEDGVASTTDPQWQTKYKDVYGFLQLPFYASLGNHDMAGEQQAQIDYSEIDRSWHMPAEYYSVAFPSGVDPPILEIFVFNTDNFTAEAETWLGGAIDASSAVWKILAMHVPIISVGPHGDDERGLNPRLLPLICNKIDLVLSGHDHIFAHLRETIDGCPIEQIVAGNGGIGLYDADETDPRLLSSGEFHGFGWYEATEESIVFKITKSDGTVFYTTSWAR